MNILLSQTKRLKKKFIMKCLLVISTISIIYFIIAGFMGLPFLFPSGIIALITSNLSLILPPWVKQPYTKRRFKLIVEDPSGQFSPEIKSFTKKTKSL